MFDSSKKSIGLDVSDCSIEIVELKHDGGSISVVNYSRAELKPGIVSGGRIMDSRAVENALLKAFAGAYAGPIAADRVVFGLPDNLVYAHIFKIIESGSRERERLVRRELAVSIPIPAEDAAFVYKVLEEKESSEQNVSGAGAKKTEVSVILLATDRKRAAEWLDLLKRLGIQTEILDIEAYSAFRGIFYTAREESVCLVDIGASLTKISVFSQGKLLYAYDIKAAGNQLTDRIRELQKTADGNKLDFGQAEKLKIQHGLDPDSGSKEAVGAMQGSLKDIFDEIRTALDYCRNHFGLKIDSVILTGGSSKLKGALEFFTKTALNLSLAGKGETENAIVAADSGEAEGQSAIKFYIGKPFVSSNDDDLPVEYVGAVGMALKGIEKNLFSGDPSFSEKDIIGISEPVDAGIYENPEEEYRTQGRLGWFNSHPNETKLLALLIIGAIAISGAFWFRQESFKRSKEKSASEPAGEYSLKNAVKLYLPIATDPAQKNNGIIRGRLIDYVIDQPGEYVKKIGEAKDAVKSALEKGEVLWEEPIIKPKDGDPIIYPLKISWLAYSDSDTKSFAMAELKKVAGGIEFMAGSFNRLNIRKTGKESMYLLEIEAEAYPKDPSVSIAGMAASTTAFFRSDGGYADDLSAQTLLPASSSEAKMFPDTAKGGLGTGTVPIISIDPLKAGASGVDTGEAKIERYPRYLVKDTPSGWLNIRSGPGISNTLVGKAYPGEEYEGLEESGGWIRIRLGEDASSTEGWVSGGYVDKIE